MSGRVQPVRDRTREGRPSGGTAASSTYVSWSVVGYRFSVPVSSGSLIGTERTTNRGPFDFPLISRRDDNSPRKRGLISDDSYRRLTYDKTGPVSPDDVALRLHPNYERAPLPPLRIHAGHTSKLPTPATRIDHLDVDRRL